MKRFLQEVVWRLSLVAMVLLCSLFQARGQEADSTKVMHPVYINTWGNVKIDAPMEIADGEDLYFTLEEGERDFWIWHDEKSVSSEIKNGKRCLSDVKGPVLLCASERREYVIDGVTYSVGIESQAQYKEAIRPNSSSIELTSMIQIDGINYKVFAYNGCFDQYENITSITFPNSGMAFWSNTIANQAGLKEIHAKALDPTKYQGIVTAFGKKDLSGVTLYVPQGCADIYRQFEPWTRFGEIVEEGELPTEFPVYVVGPGVVSYTPSSIKNGGHLVVDFTLQEGYYSPCYSPYGVADPVNSDMIMNFYTSNQVCERGGLTYALDDRATTNIVKANVSEDIEELVIPAYMASDDGHMYIVEAIWDDVFKNLSQLKKLTIEGNTTILDEAFAGCVALEEIHCKGKEPSIATFSTAFDETVKRNCVVYVPKGCVDVYKGVDAWNRFTNIVEEGTVVNTNSVRVVHNPFDSSYLQARGLDTNPSETAFIYQSEEGAEADVLMRYTIRNYDQWKGHVAISYWEDMSTYGSGQNWIQADISPEGVFEIKVSKDYIADNGQDMFYNNLRVYADQTGELLYDIQAYTNEQLALEAKDNVMTFINPISFTCGLDTIKGTVGEKIQVPITVGEVSSDLAGKEFRIDGDFWLPVDGEGKFHVYRPDGEEVNLVHTGTAGNPAQSIIVSDKDGILMGRLESNQTYTLTLVSDMEISDFHFNMISFQPMADGKDINGTNWTSPYIIDSTKMIETDSTVTDIEVETITIKAETETQITVNFEGVTSGELIVSSETNVNLNLSGDNNLGDVTNNGTLTIQTSTDVTLNATITNNGTLIDETGLITDVAGSAALNIGQMADAEVEDGSTVTLTASANIEIGVTITFQWQRLLNGVWTNVEVNDANAQMLRSASETSTLKVASANAGEYRCLITSTAPVGDTETRAASTTLAAYATVTVTEPVEPEPEPEPAYYTVTLPVVEGATIEAVGSTSVKEGESFSFTVTLKDGYVAADMVVKANGVTLTPDASGRYTIANVRSDVVITVTGIEPDPAVGVEDVETSGLKVWSAAGNLHIQTPEADRAYIVTFGGRVYKIQELPAGETAIPMPRGAYIIYVGGDSFKINM